MAYTIPNSGAASFADQAEPDSTDIDILVAGYGQSGVVSGCAVTAQGSPNNTVAVASGSVLVAGTTVAVGSGNVTMSAAHASLARKDMITVNNSGTKAYTAGTAASQPLKAAIPANSVVLAEVYVPANDNIINSTQITDKRVIVTAPTLSALSTLVVKASDETVVNNTLQDDNDLNITTVAANTSYHVKWVLRMTCTGTNADFKANLTVPTSAVYSVSAYGGLPSSVENAGTNDATNITTSIDDTDATIGLVIEGIVAIAGTVTNGIKLQWAQQTTDAVNGVIVKADSFLEYKALP